MHITELVFKSGPDSRAAHLVPVRKYRSKERVRSPPPRPAHPRAATEAAAATIGRNVNLNGTSK